ncbi:transmembrane prolyl 4-hydroxylase-like isoform X2 [Xenia sp. Carnegie-2017]|uniref:transmembrane prolyl 4-hydroxylase-like isoform X2 n=1 Tax=Xenia sp. Carnegie-2017 TaxID=2897299 RepID=UPI001F03C0FC|nr:transmembrane prolyl 4-hydroxylase-like isoform X2 [Xenia sp. Carnegie-2017]
MDCVIKRLVFLVLCFVLFQVRRCLPDSLTVNAIHDDGPCMDHTKSYALERYNPVKIGYVRTIDLGSFGQRRMITRALKPPIFEIPDFLTEDECDFIMKQAVKQGLKSSIAKGGLSPKLMPILPENVTGKLPPNEIGGRFEDWDQNNDDVIDILEMMKFAKNKHLLFLSKDDILEMIEKLNISAAKDEHITKMEFEDANILGIDSYFYKLHRLHPKHKDRYSEQTWVKFGRTANKTMTRILKRVMKLTNLSSYLVYGCEEMQVVRYQPFGHYHAHFDSETHTRQNVPCCHQVHPDQRCKICRYITVLYYLNDNYKGGETAFPVADNITLDLESIQNREERDIFNLNEFCHAANFIVKAKKRGTAIMWYNHDIDYWNGGWLGDLDGHSLHGGCMVTEGEKWIANSWLPAPYYYNSDLRSMFLNRFEGSATAPMENED